ncbi:type II secretion system F family protein [Paraburkholderia sp. LEh10]|uniref:type II secretion system F family protein n=1 Tax=Paraburkholderia sp. LEh10 TaxID=2821353 RepID=UPI001AE9E21B|nr:type II secretion system F family protein [Paraburkholderia sp. LEh10]MBP0591905.1 type II secretion system F family protein [Paraburkholderia sp. LEh10]
MTTPESFDEQRFMWRAFDAQGVRRRGTVIAPDLSSARAMLKRDTLYAVEWSARGAAPRPNARTAEVTLFTRQLSSLLRAGLPLASSLELLARTSDESERTKSMPRIVSALARDITAGLDFSSALARHPAQFGPLYCQLIDVGVASGALPAVLARLADDRERAAAQRAKVRAALTYPVAILLLAIAITAALLVWVVPTFKQIFDGFGAKLPVPTQLVLAMSAAAGRWSAPLASIGCALVFMTRHVLRRSEAARLQFARAILHLPIAGSLLTTLCAARWSRALGTLLSAGTPLADAFDSLTHATGNAWFDRATTTISAQLRRGVRLAPAMREARCFPEEIVQPVAVAEESGTLDTMLLDVASLSDRQVDEKIAGLASLCEPLVIVVLGGLVGGLVIAMYLPIIQLGNVV